MWMRPFSRRRASRSKHPGSSQPWRSPICVAVVLLASMGNRQHVDADCHLEEQIAAMYGIDVASIEIPDAEHVMFLTPAKIFQRCPVIARRAIEPRLLISFHPRRQSEHPCSLPDMYSKRWAGWVDTADDRLQAFTPAAIEASLEAGISYSWTNWMPTQWIDGVTVVGLQQALIAVLLGALLLRHAPGVSRVNVRTACLPDRVMLAALFDRYDIDHDGYLNATEYALLLHDIGANVHMTAERWAVDRKLLNAPEIGLDIGHLEILYSNPKYRCGKLEIDYSHVRELPAWPGKGGWVSDHHRLGKIIGAGTKGRVHAAVSTTARGSDVAVKILNKKALGFHSQIVKKRQHSLDQCFQEIRRLVSVGHHPNVIHITGAYQGMEEIALVMPLATGGQVYDVLTQRGKYSEAEVREVIRSIGSALSHCHINGIVHGDVKPANVLYADHSHQLVKLVDIGCTGGLKNWTRNEQATSTSPTIKSRARKWRNRHDPSHGGGPNHMPLPTHTSTTVYMAPELFVDLVTDYSCADEACDSAERDAVVGSILTQTAVAFACGFVTILLLLASAAHLNLLGALDAFGVIVATSTDASGLWEPPSPEQCLGVGIAVSLVGVAVYCHPQRAAQACRCKCWHCCANAEHPSFDPQSFSDGNEAEKVTSGCNYDEGVDIWALGVITHELLFGAVPFDAPYEAKLKSLIAIDENDSRVAVGRASNDEVGARVSDTAKDLIRGALQVDRAARLSAEALLKHRWLRQDNAVCTAALPNSVVAAVRARAKHRKTLASQTMKAWGALPQDGA